MSSIPHCKSSLVPNGKAPSSTYNHCSISYAVSFLDLNIAHVWLQIFPSAFVLIGGGHHTKYWDVPFFPYKFESFGKCHHWKQEEHWRHVVPLLTSHRLRYFPNFVLNFQDTCVVAIDGFDCSCEFGWRPLFAEDVGEERMVGHVIHFDQVNEADIRGKVVIVSSVEQGF